MHTDFFLSQVGPLLRTERTGQGCTGHLASLWGRDPSAGHQISELMGNTGQHSHLLIRTCRNSSLSSVPGGWPHSLASQVSHVGMCGAGADGSIPCYTGRQGIQTASETASYTKRGHSAQTWHNPPTLGMTYRHGCKQPITLLLHES